MNRNMYGRCRLCLSLILVLGVSSVKAQMRLGVAMSYNDPIYYNTPSYILHLDNDHPSNLRFGFIPRDRLSYKIMVDLHPRDRFRVGISLDSWRPNIGIRDGRGTIPEVKDYLFTKSAGLYCSLIPSRKPFSKVALEPFMMLTYNSGSVKRCYFSGDCIATKIAYNPVVGFEFGFRWHTSFRDYLGVGFDLGYRCISFREGEYTYPEEVPVLRLGGFYLSFTSFLICNRT